MTSELFGSHFGSGDEGGSTLLVLDIGGVLLSDIMVSELLPRFGSMIGVELAELVRVYRTEFRDKLWTGAISTAELWEGLGDAFGGRGGIRIPDEEVVALTDTLLRPEELEMLARKVPIWALSNHRAEWLYPALEDAGFRYLLEMIFCSSEWHLCKPGRAIYELLADEAEASGFKRVVYVDDQAKNFKSAEELGWETMLAAPGWDVWIADLVLLG